MTFTTSRPPSSRQVAFVREFSESARAWTRSALVVRLVQVVAGLAVWALPQHHQIWTSLILLAGLAVAVISPARNGQALVLIGAVLSWVYLPDAAHHPSLVRVLPYTLALFVLYSATTLAGTVPMSCQLRRDAWLRWLGRCGLIVAISAPLIGCVYLINDITAGVTSDALQFMGLIGVFLVIVVGTTWFTRLIKRR